MADLGMVHEKSLEHRMVVKWAKSVSRVLQVGSVAALVTIGARTLGTSGKIKIWEIEWPLKAAWVVFLALTIAHVFTGVFLVQAIENLRRTHTIEKQKAARDDLLAEAGGYVSISVRRLPAPGKRLVRMSLSDASTWVAHGGVLAAAIAVLPWWWHNGLRWPGWAAGVAIAAVGLVLMLLNWLTGSAWAVAVSRMGTTAPARGALRGTTLVATLRGVLSSAVSISAALSMAIGSVPVLVGLAWLIRLLILQR